MARVYATRTHGGPIRMATVGVVCVAAGLAVVVVSEQIWAARHAATAVSARIHDPFSAAGPASVTGARSVRRHPERR